MSETATKREREKAMVSEMIALYCRKNHHTHGKLCADCAALDNYARTRVEHCPFMETKTFCSNCRVHFAQTAAYIAISLICARKSAW